jgi:hypothetical protein
MKKYGEIAHSDHQQIVIHHGYFPILIYYCGGTGEISVFFYEIASFRPEEFLYPEGKA